MERYLSEDNYYLAVHNATVHKGGKKRKYRKARYYRDHAEEFKDGILEYAEYFYNAEHDPKLIYDGIRRKQRTIIVPAMEEQIVHHMIVNILKPVFMRSMYAHSYGSIPGRGAHAAKRRVEGWIRDGGHSVDYCLKLDIRKYFDSIPHDILKAKLAGLIHDQKFLDVLYEVIEATGTDRGIPIGFYTSQWLANWYLTGLDHYIKEVLRVEHYIRYMDDMVIFGSDKQRLHQMKAEIEGYLEERLGLQLKGNWQVFLFSTPDGRGRDLDFMGFRFFRGRTTLRKSIMLKATRKARKICGKWRKDIHDCRQMLSYLGWLRCTDTYGMYRKRIKPFVSFRNLRRYEGMYQEWQDAERSA